MASWGHPPHARLTPTPVGEHDVAPSTTTGTPGTWPARRQQPRVARRSPTGRSGPVLGAGPRRAVHRQREMARRILSCFTRSGRRACRIADYADGDVTNTDQHDAYVDCSSRPASACVGRWRGRLSRDPAASPAWLLHRRPFTCSDTVMTLSMRWRSVRMGGCCHRQRRWDGARVGSPRAAGRVLWTSGGRCRLPPGFSRPMQCKAH
jgi:hypothetical protein